MNEDFTPLAVLFGYRSGKNQLTFLGRAGLIVIDGSAAAILQILQQCSGYRTAEEIYRSLRGISKAMYKELLGTLQTYGVITDSRELFLGFHRDSANPPSFSHSLDPDEVEKFENEKIEIAESDADIQLEPLAHDGLGRIIRARKSTRLFANRQIPFSLLSGFFAALYAQTGMRSVPSAGALYPLRIFLCVSNDNQSIPQGFYEFNPAKLCLHKLPNAVSRERLYLVFDSVEFVDTAGFAVFIAGDLRRTPTKYANRGYRYALFEAGHVAQNAYLFCAEHGLGILEYGGFRDELAAEALGLRYPAGAVLLGLFVGYSDDVEKKVQPRGTPLGLAALLGRLQQHLVGGGKPIAWLEIQQLKHGTYAMPRLTAVAQYSSANPYVPKKVVAAQFAFANGATMTDVSLRVIGEAFERYVSSRLRVDVFVCAEELDAPYLDPRLVTPYTSRQYAQFRELDPFDPERKMQWVKGERISDASPVYVPVELVYYPLFRKQLQRKICYRANSSGVAAHAEYSEAVTNALLELIERDAVAVTWYSKRGVSALPDEAVPAHLHERKGFWREQGFQTHILNITLDSVPVVLTIMESRCSWPFLVSGAAAAFDFETAVAKAFNEAEFMLLSWTRSRKRTIDPKYVVSPLDHGRLYFDPSRRRHLAWLLAAEPRQPQAPPSHDPIAYFNPVVVRLDQAGDPLVVVRVLSERLLPLNFGFGTEHCGHRRLKMLGFTWKRRYPSFPHFFA